MHYHDRAANNEVGCRLKQCEEAGKSRLPPVQEFWLADSVKNHCPHFSSHPQSQFRICYFRHKHRGGETRRRKPQQVVLQRRQMKRADFCTCRESARVDHRRHGVKTNFRLAPLKLNRFKNCWIGLQLTAVSRLFLI